MPEQLGPWDVASGFVDDIDGYLYNARFGVQEEYGAVAGPDQLCFLADLLNAEGEAEGHVVFSVGSGWKTADQGASIYHDVKQNVVKTSRYGEFVLTVVQKLGVDMNQYGENALIAASWEGLGFHWNLQKMKTVGGEDKDVLFPTKFLGKAGEVEAEPTPVEEPVAQPPVKPVAKPVAKPIARPAPGKKPAPVVEPKLDAQLSAMAKSMALEAFQKAALKMAAVTDNPPLMASILSEEPTGYYYSHRG